MPAFLPMAPVAFAVVATVALLVTSALLAYPTLPRGSRSRPGYRPTLDSPSAGSPAMSDYNLHNLPAGFLTASMLEGTPGDVVGGAEPQGECPPTAHHVQQAEANQPSAFGGYEAAAQHDHGSLFGHAGGFDPSPSFDAGPAYDGGASFDAGTSGAP